MCLAVEAVIPEKEGSAEEDNAGDEPANEEDEHHEELVLTPVAHLLHQMEIGRGEVGARLADGQTALLTYRHADKSIAIRYQINYHLKHNILPS